jgi:hypothetical protein
MMITTTIWPKDDAERIRRALTTEGGHLGVGRGGFTLYYDRVRHSVGTMSSP